MLHFYSVHHDVAEEEREMKAEELKEGREEPATTTTNTTQSKHAEQTRRANTQSEHMAACEGRNTAREQAKLQ